MRFTSFVFGLVTILACTSASAQDAPPPEWNLHRVTPPPATQQDAVFPESDPVDPALYSRQMRRHQREITRLNRVMDIEGPEFDEERYDSYRNQKAGGIALVAVGGVSLISMVFYFFYVLFDDAADYENDESYPDRTEEDDSRLGEPRQRAALWTMLITGVTGIAVGVPLLITGSRGKKRQDLLRRKDEILAPFDPATASLSLFASTGGGGGLRLQVTF